MVANPSSFDYYLGLMKNLLRYLAFVLMVGSTYAQSKLPACQGRDVARWSFCFGTATYANGDKYVGEFKDGKRNGQVTYTFANGDKHVGEFRDDKRNGQGTATLANGNKYVGEFKDDKFNGQGTFTDVNGEKYVGEFRDDKRSGQGTATLANGDKYVGEFKDDKVNGQGTFYSSNGSVINQGIWADGNFVRTAPVQQASVTNQAIAVASSDWIADPKTGCKVVNPQPLPNETIEFIGNCSNGFANGKGVLTWYQDGMFKSRSEGIYINGVRKGFGYTEYQNSDKYIGDFKDNKQNGQGTYTYMRSGNKYVGEFKDDKVNGQGTEYSSNGSIIRQGIWADGNFVRTAPVQQATVTNQEVERLRAEVAESKRKQAEAEEVLRVAQQQAPQTTQTSPVISQSAIPTGKRVALVVGNKNYKVRPLQNTLNDADDISRSLRTSGFEVIDLRDATLPQMRTAVRQFGDKLLTYDVGLVYYSGHGVEVKGRNYFIPVNADIQREDEIADQGLDVSLILEKMSTAGKGVNILIVDACRDDPFGRSFRSTSRGLAQMDAPRGTIIAYSTSPGKVASDGDTRERNSPYTKHLLRAMQSPNKPIEQVFKEVRRAVQDETKNQQTPWENTSLSGDFFFKVQR